MYICFFIMEEESSQIPIQLYNPCRYIYQKRIEGVISKALGPSPMLEKETHKVYGGKGSWRNFRGSVEAF